MPRVEMSGRYRLLRRMVVTAARIAVGFECEGEERTPGSGPLIVAANHTRYLDPLFVCMAVPRRIQWMAKKEIFVFPFRGFFRFVGAFPVDRQAGGHSALRAGLRLLGEGWALGIFPEGTHRTKGVSREAKSGAIMLAARSGAKILPVYLGPVPGPIARLRGARFRTYVGEPISVPRDLKGREAYQKAADELLREIYRLPREAEGRRR
ncbi:MAG: 1-acyl-sn-glycerol-3-phosphate acyltransferase [Rubrobacteraceae bacterium]|nr:1-acyl-sn-glycerol-3-phosphate acyltransferase [Rubrobacteraceae bacterium]